MARKLGSLWLLLLMALPALAASVSSSISGVVTNAAGVPQMGAVVEILDSAAGPAALAFTDANGRYILPELAAGLYRIQVSAPSFLPSINEDVSLKTGANLVLNVTLNTLTQAVQAMPIRRRNPDDDDGWKWNLRNMANRPLLRVLE
ncbi:MAG TPA: carboxypeptidase-like regulatory domain-containing protein, partial [Anaerolineales bacterium]